MAITVKHKFVSAIPDAGDPTIVQPSNWNDTHDLTGTVPIANGGTGQATANDAFNALAPSQTGNTGKYLTTDGTNSSWAANPLGTVTSVAATVPAFLSVSGSPITTSGTLALTYSGTALPVANGGTGVTTSTGTTNVVLSGSPTIVTPVIAQINDANGNAELKFSAIASAVNQVTIENASTGNPVHVYATGTDTSIGIHLAPKGASGYVNVQGGVDSTKRFMLNPDGGTTNTRTMLSTSQTVDRTLTLPDATDTLVGKATTDTLTNKSISGSTNTLSNIGNASLTNSAITINGTSTSLGGSISVGTVTSVTGTSPVVSSGGATPAISMPAATSSVNGYLTSADWTTFNGKGSGTVTSVTGTAPVVSSGGATPAISMAAATGSVNGYLTSTDWTTFNNKGSGTVTSVAALTLGTTGTDLSSTVATGTTTPVITLQVPTASATNRGALSAADWTTFNGKANAFTYTSNYIPYGQGTTTPAQSSALQFNGTTFTTTNDASISGLTVGKGGGAVAGSSALGYQAAYSNTTGLLTAIGYQAGYSHATTFAGTYVGRLAGKNTTGGGNNFFGDYTGISTTSGVENSAFGGSAASNSALQANTTGSYNTAFGNAALSSNTTASYNTAVGYQAGYGNTTGTSNYFGGYQAGYGVTTGSFNTALGGESLFSGAGDWNTAIGRRSLNLNTGGANTAVGGTALYVNTSGGNNTALGYSALYSNTTASNNTAVGYQAGYTNQTGTHNTAIGGQALYLNTANNNTALGFTTLYSNSTGTSNTGLGYETLYANTTGSYNTAVGQDALVSNTTASSNTAVGYQAGYAVTTSQNNVLIGTKAGYSLTSASGGNVIIGYQAGYNSTGYGNTFIGGGVPSLVDGAGTVMTTGNKNTIIGNYTGNQGGIDIRTSSNNVVLSDGDGNIAGRWANGGGWFQLNNSTVWSITSDARIKKNVVSLETGLDVISSLRPVEFDYIADDKHDIGFIAQEYQTVLPSQISEGKDGMLSLNQNLVPYLVKAIQELKAEIDQLKGIK